MADISYTSGYYKEINPQRVKLAFLNTGLFSPVFGSGFELGFGQGLFTTEENFVEFTDQANTFAEKQLPFLNTLQIT